MWRESQKCLGDITSGQLTWRHLGWNMISSEMSLTRNYTYLYIFASTVLTQRRSQSVCNNLFEYKTQNIDRINLVMTSS